VTFYKIPQLLTKVFLHRADDGAKAAVHLLDAARQTGETKKRTAANIAFNYSETLFEWMASLGNEWRGERAGRAMVQLHEMANGGIGEGKSRTDSVQWCRDLHESVDFPWHGLKCPIIDIGGGIGSFESAILLVPQNKDLNFMIFDIEKTVEHAKKVFFSLPRPFLFYGFFILYDCV